MKEEHERTDDGCTLCNYADRLLESPAILCDGAECKLRHKRIPRGARMHILADSKLHICSVSHSLISTRQWVSEEIGRFTVGYCLLGCGYL